ncbi:MAG: leucine-rich repeat protein [Clostridia bacterium]|nr:leucine-rich repeat protein [Clostridia bacterium]
MKKKILLALAFVLVVACLVAMSIINVFAEGEQITISYMNTQETTSDTTSLDTTAYEGGKQTVTAGEKFTLPTTSSSSYTGQEGFQLVWYTENGRTYKAGEEVSFDKDTKLFRAVAKECYTLTDVNYAMANESTAAILMADISASSSISVKGEGQSVLILNGFTIDLSKNSGGFMGAQRSGKHIYGEGTINATNSDGKLGSYYFFQDQSHGYNGTANKTVIGVDVTINCPTMWLGADGDGSYNNHYPWTRIYGKVNCYGLISISTTGNRAPMVEIFDGANVTITGPSLFKDNSSRGNSSYTFNHQAFELRIYGGTLNLPAEATTEEFWTNDNKESYVDGTTNYYNYGLTKNTQDVIKIFGGSFVLPDDAVPAISDYLVTDWIGSIPNGGNGLVNNSNNSTYYVCYMNRPGYKFVFEKYTIAEGAYGKLTVTDYIDGSLSGTYYYQMTTGTIEFVDPYYAVHDTSKQNITQNTIDEIIVYELNSETSEYTVTDKFQLDFGMGNTILFKNSITTEDKKLQNLEANSTIFQVVVPADCEHSFSGEPLEATCEHGAYADYNCTVCGHNVYFSWGDKLDHNYALGEHIQATATSLGSKTYTCSMCNNTVEKAYSTDPTGLEVSVTIRNDDGTFENVTVLASEIFDFATSGSGGDYIYTLSAIKTFDSYNIRNIYGVTIPKGILYMNITSHNYEKYNNVEYGVAVLTIGEGSTIQIQNIGNLRRVEKIVIEKNTDVTFAPSCSYYNPSNERRDMQIINEIDLSAGSHTVTFMSNAFDGRGKIATLTFGENAIYNFGHKAFNNCAILELDFLPSSEFNFTSTHAFYGNDMSELVFPDNFDMTFKDKTFENCPNLTTVTFGKGSTYVIGSQCFLYCPIESVKLTAGSTYTISSQAFMNKALTELDMSAGDMTVTLNSSAFNCWHNNADYANVTSIKFGPNSTYYIGKEALARVDVETLTLAANSTYTFAEYVINNCTTLITIDASAEGIVATWNGSALRGRTTLTSILLGKNGNHIFNGSSFFNTGITELVLGEGSTYVFKSNCFNDSTPLAKIDASASNLNVTMEQNAFESKGALETLLINGENSTYSFGNYAFKKTIIKDLTLGEGSTYTFGYKCFDESTAIATIDASAPNMNVTFKNESFTNRTSLVSLKLGKNSTYSIERYAFNNTNLANDIVFASSSVFSIGEKAFYSTAFSSITFEDNCNVTFTGGNAFQENDQATYLYIGKNIAITNYPFKNLKNLEKLIIMDGVTHANEYEFEGAGSSDFATPFVVYNHSSELIFNKGMFNNCDGVVLYTITDNIGTRSDVFMNCADVTTSDGTIPAWTVILGLPHALVKSQVDPTCTEVGGEIWIGDGCPCGLVITEETTVNVYEKQYNITDSTETARQDIYTVDIIEALGHNKVDLIEIIYASDIKFFGRGDGHYTCSRCDEIAVELEEFDPIFKFLGLSYTESQTGVRSVMQGFVIDREMMTTYNDNSEYDIVGYGLVAGTVRALGENAEIFDENGAVTNQKAGVVNISARQENYDMFEMKISGLNGTVEIEGEDPIDLSKVQLYCCGYCLVQIGDNVASYYANNGVITETLSDSVSYESLSTQQ